MIFKILFFIGFLSVVRTENFSLNLIQTKHFLQAIIGAENEEDISFNVEKEWQSYKKKDECCTCQCDDDDGNAEWIEGVQAYYNGVRKASWNFRGPSKDLADAAVNSLADYMKKLIFFANSNSTVLNSSSKAMLESLSKCSKVGSSDFTIIDEFDKVLLGIVQDFTVIVSKLSPIIGELTCPFNKALNNFGCTQTRFMDEFLMCYVGGSVKRIDYAPVIEESQVLTNTVALIADTLLNECKSATQDVYEAVTVLTLILDFVLIVTQGIDSCAQSVTYEEESVVPEKVEICSVTLVYLVVEVTQSITAVTFPFVDSITTLLTNLVNITIQLNATLKDIFGLFKGVEITVEQITKNLSKTVSATVTGVSKGLINILKGIDLRKSHK